MSDVTVDKSLLAFLNGISKRLYFGEQSISDDFLRKEVLHISVEGIVKKCSVILGQIPLSDEVKVSIFNPKLWDVTLIYW